MDDLHGLNALHISPPARRGFVMGTLMAGFTMATAHGQAAPIHTDSTGLNAGEVRIPVSDGPIPAYVASPAGRGRHPVVLAPAPVRRWLRRLDRHLHSLTTSSRR